MSGVAPTHLAVHGGTGLQDATGDGKRNHGSCCIDQVVDAEAGWDAVMRYAAEPGDAHTGTNDHAILFAHRRRDFDHAAGRDALHLSGLKRKVRWGRTSSLSVAMQTRTHSLTTVVLPIRSCSTTTLVTSLRAATTGCPTPIGPGM